MTTATLSLDMPKKSAKPPRSSVPQRPASGRKMRTPDELREMTERGIQFREILEAWQQQSGRSYQDLASEAGVAFNAIYNYMRGKADPSLVALRSLSAVLPIRVVIEKGQIKIERR
jgi:ribosome-binding protein aMBF1 (putative translation factor)